jgi:hypothetical protein
MPDQCREALFSKSEPTGDPDITPTGDPEITPSPPPPPPVTVSLSASLFFKILFSCPPGRLSLSYPAGLNSSVQKHSFIGTYLPTYLRQLPYWKARV